MKYFLGIDGGNSKTHALILDEDCNPLGFGLTTGSDYQEVGLSAAKNAWEEAMSLALQQAGLSIHQLETASFCLAGADLPEDYETLNLEVKTLISPTHYDVKNDSIAALRAGLPIDSYGVTVVVGAGFNAAGRGKDGQEIILPGLGYQSGDYGGGRWIGRQIIRAVMRGYDGRQIKTALRNPVLDIMGAKDELELMRILRKGELEDQILDLVPILFEAAYEGDEVAQSLIIFLGEEVALTATTIIHRLGLQEEEVPVVLSTSVYQGKGPLFLDIIIANLHRVAPKAKVITPIFIPVVGAVFEAMSAKGVICNNKCLAHLKKSLIQSHPYLLQNEYFPDA